MRLDCGRELHPVRVAYETYGALSPRRDNVILVCHALSGDAHAAGSAKTPPEESTRDGFGAEDRDGAARRGLGWWDGMIGPGKAFDTDRFFVVSTNLLGGCRGTTGPSSIDPATGQPYGPDFPVITVADMVRTERAFLNALGIERLAAVAGGSLGGMQAFEWAILFPDQVDAVVAIASTHALHPQGVAWNAIARAAIMGDPAWQGGRYYGTGAAPEAGMGVARMVGHVTYLSAQALDDKFGRRLQFADDIRYTITEPEFEVESYLRHQADSFVRRFDANTYLYTSRALTYFDLARQYGGGSLASGTQRHFGAHAADRVQFRLAVPAVCVRGNRGGASRSRQARRVPCDRSAVRPRLLPAGGSSPDADHPPVSEPAQPGRRRGSQRMTSRKESS